MVRILKLFYSISILILFAAGCSSNDKNPVVTITWDGQTCNYQGPEKINTDEVKLIYQAENPDERVNVLRFKKLEDGKSWEDFLAILPNDGAGGMVSEAPPFWLKSVIGSTGESDNEFIFSVNPGEYAIWCYIWLPDEFYPGGLLIVE